MGVLNGRWEIYETLAVPPRSMILGYKGKRWSDVGWIIGLHGFPLWPNGKSRGVSVASRVTNGNLLLHVTGVPSLPYNPSP